MPSRRAAVARAPRLPIIMAHAPTEAKKFAGRITGLILDLISGYVREGKYHLTVAIGCTGGRHRSVVMAEEIASRLEENGRHATVKHRDA